MEDYACYCGCLPQKAELVYLIPAIRKGLAVCLSKRMSDKEAAAKLELTKSAISQYVHKKRASLKLPNDLMAEIAKSADKIAEDRGDWRGEMSHLLRYSKQIGCTCQVCKRTKK